MQKLLLRLWVRAPLPLQQATARGALCAVGYWLARLVLNGLCSAVQTLWLAGPGVGAAPAVWQAVQWGGTLVGGTLALAVPVALAGRRWPDRFELRLRPARSSLLRLALPV